MEEVRHCVQVQGGGDGRDRFQMQRALLPREPMASAAGVYRAVQFHEEPVSEQY